MDATSPPEWSRQAEPTVIEWVNTSKCHKHVLNTRCFQVATTTDNSNVKVQFNSSLVFKILGFVQFWNKEVYGRYVKYMHLPCICPTSS